MDISKPFDEEVARLVKKDKKQVSIDRFTDLRSADDSFIKFEKEEMKKLIKKSIMDLSVRYGEVLALHYLEEKPHEEISDILRIPVGTVGTWISRGKQMLRKILKDQV